MTTAEIDEPKLILTADEAIDLLAPGPRVHNFMQSGIVMLGCDYDRARAIAALRRAKSIEIGGPACKAMKHAIAMFAADGKLSFFAADMAKVAAFEASRAQRAAT